MADNQRHSDPVESALAELGAAERARLFQRTQVDTGDLVRAELGSPTTGFRRLGIRLVPIAAVLLLALTVWSWMFSQQIQDVRLRKAAVMARLDDSKSTPKSFSECISGPSAMDMADSCRVHDRNGDGRIDLRDFGALQLAYATPNP